MMSIDHRTRQFKDIRSFARDEVFDAVLVAAAQRNGELTADGLHYTGLPALGLDVEGRGLTLTQNRGSWLLQDGLAGAGVVATMSAAALSELVQDQRTTMGLAMTSQVSITQGEFDSWIGWEPVLRSLLDGRPVYQPGLFRILGRDGHALNVQRSFTLDDDRDEMSHFLEQAGFLHIKRVFTEDEMAAVSADLDGALARARPDDGASWWAGDSAGVDQAVRVLWFEEQSPALNELLHDQRLQWLASLTGDAHDGSRMSAEGLIKPLDIRTGLSDLPWHKDCGQGLHSYLCNGLTVGISVTGADSESGALGVVPGSHRANVLLAGLDKSLDMEPIKLSTQTGDITVHCSDTLHRAHHPTVRTRKVVYTSFGLAPKPGDTPPRVASRDTRSQRANLSNVRDRISESGGGAEDR